MADWCAPSSLAALANATRVVATTVGPYRPHGLKVVEACVAAGTDYVDLSGEVLFIRDSIDSYQASAEGAGTRIVHSCGFDSIRRISQCCSCTKPPLPTELAIWRTRRWS